MQSRTKKKQVDITQYTWAVARCVSNECEDFISEKLLEDAYCCNDCTVEVEDGGTGLCIVPHNTKES